MKTTMQESPTDQPRPPAPGRLARDVVRDLWRALTPLIIFEVAFKTAVVLVGALGAGWVMAPLIASTGHSAVTNTEIARFLLSTAGLLYLVLIAMSLMVATLIEHVGVIAIAAAHLRGRDVTVSETLSTLAVVFLRLVSFGIKSLGTLAFLCAPFVVLGGLTYLALLSRHDINYYLSNRPAGFYAALGIGSILLAVLAARLAVLYVDLVFVMPILLFEGRRGGEAISASRARAAGARLRIGAILLGWQVAGTLASVAMVWGYNRLSASVLGTAEPHPLALVPLVTVLLACQAVLVAAVSFVAVAIHCLLILRLYLARGGSLDPFGAAEPAPVPTWVTRIVAAVGARRWRLLRLRVVIVLAILGFIGYLGFSVPGRLETGVRIVVVAHRGYSRLAPENTLSAFRKAIAVEADFAELDVQETADGVVVVLHDRDLMRLAGDPRRIADITFAEARKLDLGRRFSPEFAGERIPTLAEVIELARGQIKLQIELKYYGKDRGLARKVAELIAREAFESECEVTSLDLDGLMTAKRHNPRLKLVPLVTYALGDPGRLPVDGLSVNTQVLSDRLIRAARRHRKELYAWTVDDPRAMLRLIERGVGGLVTNAPEELIRIRRERAALGDVERRLLAARYLLGLESEEEAQARP